jgi:hypothetical protein
MKKATLHAWFAGHRELARLLYQFDNTGVCNTKAEFVAEMDQHLPEQA